MDQDSILFCFSALTWNLEMLGILTFSCAKTKSPALLSNPAAAATAVAVTESGMMSQSNHSPTVPLTAAAAAAFPPSLPQLTFRVQDDVVGFYRTFLSQFEQYITAVILRRSATTAIPLSSSSPTLGSVPILPVNNKGFSTSSAALDPAAFQRLEDYLVTHFSLFHSLVSCAMKPGDAQRRSMQRCVIAGPPTDNNNNNNTGSRTGLAARASNEASHPSPSTSASSSPDVYISGKQAAAQALLLDYMNISRICQCYRGDSAAVGDPSRPQSSSSSSSPSLPPSAGSSLASASSSQHSGAGWFGWGSGTTNGLSSSSSQHRSHLTSSPSSSFSTASNDGTGRPGIQWRAEPCWLSFAEEVRKTPSLLQLRTSSSTTTSSVRPSSSCASVAAAESKTTSAASKQSSSSPPPQRTLFADRLRSGNSSVTSTPSATPAPNTPSPYFSGGAWGATSSSSAPSPLSLAGSRAPPPQATVPNFTMAPSTLVAAGAPSSSLAVVETVTRTQEEEEHDARQRLAHQVGELYVGFLPVSQKPIYKLVLSAVDSPDYDMGQHFQDAVFAFIHGASIAHLVPKAASRSATLVHCSAGMHRSAAMVVGYHLWREARIGPASSSSTTSTTAKTTSAMLAERPANRTPQTKPNALPSSPSSRPRSSGAGSPSYSSSSSGSGNKRRQVVEATDAAGGGAEEMNVNHDDSRWTVDQWCHFVHEQRAVSMPTETVKKALEVFRQELLLV